MAPLPPPQGMSEADYETIEAAVTETVRGRWFLGEFARRNRAAEMRQLLDAMTRIEGVVSATQRAIPPSDPSIRLLMQRVKEIAAQLESLSDEMREGGIDPRFPDAVETQARAVAGMLRSPGRAALPPKPGGERTGADAAERESQAAPALPPVAPGRPPAVVEAASDPRLPLLSALDGLPLAEKLALFT